MTQPILDRATALFRNGDATMPTTHSARANHAFLLRTSADVGYAAIGRATGHDKSWVSRFLSGQGLVSLAEVLHWLDAVSGVIVHPNESGVDEAASDLLQALRGELSARDAGREISQDEARAAIAMLRVMLARDAA
jgi:hypothetical protein